MARSKPTTTSDVAPDGEIASPVRNDGDSYTVVARRYRPQTFDEVVGQDHVVQALRNAIKMGRVTHAYLFSGTRGVGKTSMARIFAKCLNCEHGPTDEPCNQCDICKAISVGQDVDVIEIDGASNNGVEAVRELRQNAGLRPSRSRYKIYYIDEVHMLSTGAFNALLKTLEEPPEHVKFFFATTEPNKIPITVLSRCQKYDFAGITPEQIVDTLAGICEKEHVEADRDALQAVARRAAGSMRDAQSLLEQLLSFGGKRLTAEVVHKALGIAPDEHVLDLVDAMANHDPASALRLLDQAVSSGVQPADLLGGALDFLRDVMVLAAGADVAPLAAAPSQRERLKAVAGRWPLDSILAALQILSEARGRLRGSPQGRLIVELALCRVARLEDLVELSELIGRLSSPGSGPTAAPVVKKKAVTAEAVNGTVERDRRESRSSGESPPPPAPSAEPTSRVPGASPRDFSNRPFTIETIQEAWPSLVEQLGNLGSHVNRLRPASLPEPGVLAVAVPGIYNWAADACDTIEARGRIESALRALLGRSLTIRFDREQPATESEPAKGGSSPPAPQSGGVRPEDLADDPLVQDVLKLFEARPVRLEADDGSGS